MPFYEIRYKHTDRPESSKAFSTLAPDEKVAKKLAEEWVESEKKSDPGWVFADVELLG